LVHLRLEAGGSVDAVRYLNCIGKTASSLSLCDPNRPMMYQDLRRSAGAPEIYKVIKMPVLDAVTCLSMLLCVGRGQQAAPEDVNYIPPLSLIHDLIEYLETSPQLGKRSKLVSLVSPFALYPTTLTICRPADRTMSASTEHVQASQPAVQTRSTASSGSDQRQSSSGYYSLNRWLGEDKGDGPWSTSNLRGFSVRTKNICGAAPKK
jgi:hypothetical protein